jgi:hypothetical protein
LIFKVLKPSSFEEDLGGASFGGGFRRSYLNDFSPPSVSVIIFIMSNILVNI